LDKGEFVILDRYVYSNIAFQCAKAKGAVEAEMIREWILDTEFRKFAIPEPDLNLFLDVPLKFVDKKLNESREGEEREYLKGKKDIHESSITFQEKVRDIYVSECNRGKDLVRIDCSDENGEMLSADSIFMLIRKEMANIE